MESKSIKEQKKAARNTNELLDHLKWNQDFKGEIWNEYRNNNFSDWYNK